MSKKFFLPIKSGNDANMQLPEIGRWEERENVFRNISSAIAGDEYSIPARVHSIPDMWARPLLFETALLDEKHPKHKSVVEEWRGLLATLALSQYAGIDLEYVPVRFDDNQSFSSVALKLAPKSKAHRENSWSDIHIIRVAGSVVGITSPSTIVCTREDYFIAQPSIKWFVNGKLEDPLSVLVNPLNGERECVIDPLKRKAIREWLHKLLDEVNLPTSVENSVQDGVTKRLQEFIGELEKGETPAHKFKWNNRDLGIGSAVGVYKALTQYPAPPETINHPSDVEIIEGLRVGDRRILLVSDSIPVEWREKAHNIRFWNEHVLDEALQKTAVSNNKTDLNGSSLDGASWLAEKDIFLDQIYFFDGADVFKNCLKIKGNRETQSIVIPFRHQIGELFNPHYISDNLRIEKNGGRIQVTLRLMLSGPQGSGRKSVDISKIYAGNDIIQIYDTPLFDVWPPFSADDWNTYYSHFDPIDALDVSVSFSPKYKKDDHNTDSHRKRSVRGRVSRELSVLNRYPDVAWIKDGDDTEVGILLLSPPPQHVESRPNEWNVGVDFGTANTTVFYREDDGDRIAHVELDVKPLGLFDHPERNRFNTEYFVPSKEEKPQLRSSSFPTVYKVFDSVQSSHKTWLDGHIQFQNPDHRVEVGKNIYHNLKWANDQESKIVNKAFIDQLIDLIVAKARSQGIDKIKWSYSVPSAFSLYQRETFDNVWVESLRRKGQRNKPICRTESLCSALYFKEVEGATPKKGAICLDVGGKTTDIAVWQDNRLVFQTSLKCASHDILLESLAKKPSAVASILPGLNLEASTELEDRLFSIQNSLQAQPLDDLRSRLDIHAADPELRIISQQVALGLGAMLFIVGRVVRRFVDDGKMNGSIQGIYLGGNGAKMLDWLAGGDFDNSTLTVEYLRHVYFAGYGDGVEEIPIRRTRRGNEKREVGHGLVSPSTLDDITNAICISGENLERADGEILGSMEVITPEILSQGVELKGLETLKAFTNCYQEWASDHTDFLQVLDDNDIEWSVIENNVDQKLSDLKGKEKDKIDFDGVFITAIREMIKKL